MEILGTRPLETALVRAEERLADAGHRFAVAFEQRTDLLDDVGKRDTMSQPVRFNACCPEMGTTLFVNLLGDSRRGPTHREPTRPGAPRQLRFLVLSAGHTGPSFVTRHA
ncbi:hypothetical protein GCM10009677_47780 [Sphaerisporangium rubeum]